MVQAELENFEVQLVQGSTKKAMHSANASSRDLWQVEIESIRVIDNFNVRIKDDKYDAHIRALADSMKSEGFYQDKPLAGYVAKDGEAEKEIVTFYVTDDENHLPIRLDMFLNFGSAKAFLSSVSGNKHPLTSAIK